MLRSFGFVAVLFATLAAGSATHAALSSGLEVFSSMDGLTVGDPLHYWEDVSGNGRHILRNIEVQDRSADMNAIGATNTHVTAADFEEGSANTSLTATVIDGFNPVLEPGTSDYSFSLWYHETSTFSFAYILNNGNTASSREPGFAFHSANGQPQIRIQAAGGDDSTRVNLSSGLGNISGSGWHHVVGTFDRTGVHSAPNTVSLYVDGMFTNSAVLPDVGGSPYNISLPNKQLRIGGRELSNYNFEGYVDDVAIYQGVLSPTDVTTLLAASSVDANTITAAGITPLAIYNFENNLFDEYQAGTVPDDFDGNPGVLHGGEKVTDSIRGEVLSFSGGTEERVDYGDILNPGSGSYTVSAWFNVFTSSGPAQGVAFKGNSWSGSEGWGIFVENGNLYVRACYEHENTDTRVQTGTSVTGGEWHHVALVLDADAGTLTAYLDGLGSGAGGDSNGWVPAYSGVTFPVGVDFMTEDPLVIGNRPTLGAGLYGMMDDFAVWNRALSEQEILAIFNGADILDGGPGQPGDLNGDGLVNSADLDLVRGNWGSAVQPGTSGDANGDGFVNSADLDIVRSNWGAGAAAAVPEPSMVALLVGVFAPLGLIRRK